MSDEEFAGFVKRVREELSLKQEELAHLVGVSHRTIARWEAGESVPTSEPIKAKLCELAEGTSLANEARASMGMGPGFRPLDVAMLAGFGVSGMVMGKLMRRFLAESHPSGHDAPESEISLKTNERSPRDPRETIVFSVADVAARELGVSLRDLAESIQRILAAAEVSGLRAEELVELITKWASSPKQEEE